MKTTSDQLSAPNPSTPEATRQATEWRTTQRTYPAIRGTNQLAVTPEEFDEALEAYAELRNREVVSALKKLTGLIRDCHNVFQNHSASWLMQQPSFANAEEVIRKAERDQ